MDKPNSSIRQEPTGDGFDTLYSDQYRQTFHSKHGALTEAEYVFLQGTGVTDRLTKQQPTVVLEVGFGTGLNFFATAHRSREANTILHYVALEKDLLADEVLEQLNHSEKFAAMADIRQAFVEWRNTLGKLSPFSLLRWNFGENIHLELVLGDATHLQIPKRAYHAIYQDAFSPDANPELWTEEFLARLHQVLTPGGKLATYSVKGDVKRNLKAVGFKIEKQPGPPGKREMLVATK